MPNKVEAYKCVHCSMTSLFKGHVTRHEKHSCKKNPNRPNCRSCANLEHESEVPSSGCPINPQLHGNYEPWEPPTWWCPKIDADIPPDDIGITRECECFELEGC